MAPERSLRWYRNGYSRLLRLYSQPYRERFGESMEQTFADRLRERAGEKRSVFGCALGMFVETSVSLFKEDMMGSTNMVRVAARVAALTALPLLLPLLAMQFTDEVAWDLADFAVAGALLFGAGLAVELIARKGSTGRYRAAVAVAVGAALILVWINLAVGIIGPEENPANWMYAGVLAVGIAGALAARFQPQGMSLALFATALAQMLVGVIALVAGLGFAVVLNGVFVVLWLGSALLFRHAARTQPV